MTQEKPLFKMEKDFEEAKLLIQKLAQTFDDGATVKCESPTCDGLSIEALFYCITEFKEACKGLNWDTGDELFTNFCLVLHGTAYEKWLQPLKILRRMKSMLENCFKRPSTIGYLHSLMKMQDTNANDIH
jgi:hypothetical protein